MAAKGTIERFLKTAERRHRINLALECTALAAGSGAAGLIVLLLLGTQVFDWYWPALLFVVALAAASWRARRQFLSRYRLAQVIDSKLGLSDRVSTVVFFEKSNETPETLVTVERQAEERLASQDPAQAMPVCMPKHGYAGIALVTAAIVLVGIRYGVLRSLDFSPPLARIEFDSFQQPSSVEASTKKSAIQERFEEQLRQLGIQPEDLTNSDDPALNPEELNVDSIADQGGDMQESAAKRDGSTPQSPDDEGMEAGEKSHGDGSDAAADGEADRQQQPGKQPPKDAKQGSSGSQDGLMNKMRDALANLLNKLKTPARSELQESAMNQSPGQQGSQQSNEQGMQSRGKSNGEGQPSQDQQGQEGPGEKMPGDQGRSGEKSAENQGNQDSKTGMGRQDGAKDIKDAEQLAAMGKISEIFGKRAQQITGEMTVEVSSSKQTLKTAYTQRKADHSDSGGEVNRDEIPLAYQSYIQRYFEEVRKSPQRQTQRP